jgi:hypothetical protein
VHAADSAVEAVEDWFSGLDRGIRRLYGAP